MSTALVTANIGWISCPPVHGSERHALYDRFDFLPGQKKRAEADLLREAKKHPIVKIWETAPGFGGIRAARLVPIVITAHISGRSDNSGVIAAWAS
jgi:hypothetical protein